MRDGLVQEARLQEDLVAKNGSKYDVLLRWLSERRRRSLSYTEDMAAKPASK